MKSSEKFIPEAKFIEKSFEIFLGEAARYRKNLRLSSMPPQRFVSIENQSRGRHFRLENGTEKKSLSADKNLWDTLESPLRLHAKNVLV